MNYAAVSAVSRDDGISQITLKNIPAGQKLLTSIFSSLSAFEIEADMIIQSSSLKKESVSFTVKTSELSSALSSVKSCLPEEVLRTSEIVHVYDASKISVSGVGIIGTPEVASTIMRILLDGNIDILALSSSELKLSVIVRLSDAQRAFDSLKTLIS